MNKGQKILLLIGVAIIASAGILYFTFRKNPNVIETPVTVMPPVAAPIVVTLPAIPVGTAETDQATIQNMAMAFSERFGTYANQNGGFSASTLKPIVTETLYTWLSTTYVKDLAKNYPTGPDYRGVETDALAVRFVSYAADAAVVMVTVEQKTVKGTETTTTTRELKLELVKSSTAWQIDHAYWQRP